MGSSNQVRYIEVFSNKSLGGEVFDPVNEIVKVPEYLTVDGKAYSFVYWSTPFSQSPPISPPENDSYALNLADAGGTKVFAVDAYYIIDDGEGGGVIYVWTVDENGQKISGHPDPILHSQTGGPGHSYDSNLGAYVVVDMDGDQSPVVLSPAPHVKDVSGNTYKFQYWNFFGDVTDPASLPNPHMFPGDLSIPYDIFALVNAVYALPGAPPPTGSVSHKRPPLTLDADETVAVLFGAGDAGGLLFNLGQLAKGIVKPQPVWPYPAGRAALDAGEAVEQTIGRLSSATPTAEQLENLHAAAADHKRSQSRLVGVLRGIEQGADKKG